MARGRRRGFRIYIAFCPESLTYGVLHSIDFLLRMQFSGDVSGEIEKSIHLRMRIHDHGLEKTYLLQTSILKQLPMQLRTVGQ